MKVFIKYLLIAGLFFMIGFFYEYHVPRLKTWLLVELEDFSTKNLPFRIFARKIDFKAWPPGIELAEIKAIPKGGVSKSVAPIQIEEIHFQLRPRSLLGGDFRLSEIVIVRPQITLLISEDEAQKKKSTSPIKISDLLEIPIQNIQIENALLQIRNPSTALATRIEDLSLELENRPGALVASFSTKKALVRVEEKGSRSTRLEAEATALLSEDEILLRGLKVSTDKSFLIASGKVNGRIDEQVFTNILFKSRSSIDFPELRFLAQKFRSTWKLPEVKGQGDFETVYFKSLLEPEQVAMTLKIRGLVVSQFKIGNVEGQVGFKQDTITASKIQVRNPAGTLEIEDGSFQPSGENHFRALLKAQDLELRKLLVALGVGDTPLYLPLQGTLPCQGRLKPEFGLSCTGTLGGSELQVYKKNSKDTIVSLERFSMTGQVNVDTKAVTAKADLSIGESKGEASAIIKYDEGFDIQYSTPELRFQDIKNLAGLKVEGSAAIKGATSGDSDSAVFAMRLNGKDLWFEDYGLGKASADLSYRKGNLFFRNMEGLLNTTQYFAAVTVDLLKDRIKAEGRLGFAEARDIQAAFIRKVELPFEMFGNAQAKVSVSGPFHFNQLTYDLDSAVYRGTVANETFDEARFQVSAVEGNVKTQTAYLKKGAGVATMVGQGFPTGQINTEIKGRNFRVEDLSLFNQNDSAVTGSLNFDMTLKGHVLSPDAKIQGSVTGTQLAGEGVPDSKFALDLSRSAIGGEAHFLDDKVWAEFIFPLDATQPFKLKGKTTGWSFTPLFGLITREPLTKEFTTELSSDFDLYAPTGGFWNMTGKLSVSKLRIQRGNLELYNPQPSVLTFEEGKMSARDFLLLGDNTYLKLEAQDSRKSDFNVSLNGKIELSLLAFLTPFFSDLRGIMSVAGQLDGNAENPKLIGSAFIDRGYAKLKELPHPFENIRGDFLFNQQRVVVNSIQASFAGGTGYGDGTVEFKGLRKFPTDIKGRFEKVSLLVPKDFSTNGSGTFRISGEWFPFLLGGTYNISSGLISREFGDNPAELAQVSRSHFLPSILVARGVSPIQFDLDTQFPSGLIVRNSMVDTEIRGHMRIQGTPDRPILLGNLVTAPGGKLMFRDVPFEIASAEMKFDSPTKINPTLFATANTRVHEYDVNLIVQGTKEDYKLILRSTPPLPEQDIISLLALGYTPQQLENVQSNEQIDQQSYEIGGALLSKNALGSEIKNRYGINVRFGSALDDNTKTVAPKVIVSKEWTPRISTSASRAVGTVVTQDVKLEYKLNPAVSVIGSWEGKEYSEESKATDVENRSSDILGLDLQYRKEFK